MASYAHETGRDTPVTPALPKSTAYLQIISDSWAPMSLPLDLCILLAEYMDVKTLVTFSMVCVGWGLVSPLPSC